MLLALAADGNHDAFSEFYDLVSPIVFGIARRVLVDRSLAEETLQDVMLELWRQAPRFDQAAGSVTGWVSTIAHRRAVDRVRSEQSHRNRHEAEALKVEIDFDSVAEAIEGDFEMGRLREALTDLPAAQRESILLAYFGGKTYRDVAAELGIAEGTAKTRIRDGLQKLRFALVEVG
ncbi:MAG: sigma-70 family RNA polymerase sigma factor [Acidimicrobiales bacterium]|nr:sigma-70 family RNA polymerase sigma factor [Acidimicrobiales bacterium]